jgi:hypothetical protein
VKARGSLSACCGERKKGHKVARLSFEDFDLPPTASRGGFTANFIGLSLVTRTQRGRDQCPSGIRRAFAGCGGQGFAT